MASQSFTVRLARAVADLPDSASIAFPVAELRAWLAEAPENATPATIEPAEPDWPSLLWTLPAERRIGVRELAAALGRGADFVYRHTTARAENRIPHRRFGGELEFVVGEVREWLRQTEDVVVRGVSDRVMRRAG